LTFVFGAISHAKVKKFLGCNNPNLAPGSSSRLGALRMAHESYKKLPENVEVVKLLEAGLINLLGLENYLFVKKYNENTVLENRGNNIVTALSLFVLVISSQRKFFL
jgi:hypothetical protein